MSTRIRLVYMGAHYKLCPLELREVWSKAFSDPVLRSELMRHLKVHEGEAEAVGISTCNRFDLVYLGPLEKSDLFEIFLSLVRLVESQAGAESKFPHLDVTTLAGYLRYDEGEKAATMLFQVSSSLDSLVLGEPHILGQVKDAFSDAVDRKESRAQLESFFAKAFSVAKRVRNETDLAKNGVSIGHAAVEVARRVFDDFAPLKVLIVGAGEMAKVVAKHFAACGATRLDIANRSVSRAETISRELVPLAVCVLNLDAALRTLLEYDVVVVATSSQKYLITPDLLQPDKVVAKQRRGVFGATRGRSHSGQPKVIVDISVPRNVDPIVGKLDDVFLFDVDDLDKVMEGNREARKAAAEEAMKIVDAETSAFFKSQLERESLSQLGRFHAYIQGIVFDELNRESLKKAALSSERVDILSRAITKRIVASPATLARREIQHGEESKVAEALDALFLKKEDL